MLHIQQRRSSNYKICSKQQDLMFTNLVLLHLYRRLLGRHAEKNLKILLLISKTIRSHSEGSEYARKRQKTHRVFPSRKLLVTQLTHVLYTVLLRMSKFALHRGYSSPVKIQNGAEVGQFWTEDCDRNPSFGH